MLPSALSELKSRYRSLQRDAHEQRAAGSAATCTLFQDEVRSLMSTVAPYTLSFQRRTGVLEPFRHEDCIELLKKMELKKRSSVRG